MKIKSKNYPEALQRREQIEELLDKAYAIAFHLQDMYNEIDSNIIDYEREQSALDE